MKFAKQLSKDALVIGGATFLGAVGIVTVAAWIAVAVSSAY